MKILAVGAHPDDIEIFMFGLITKLKDRGDKIYLMVATDGSMGGDNIAGKLKNKRKLETTSALKNFSTPIFLNLPDGHLGDEHIHKSIIREKIRNIKPDLIITHNPNDYHSDHRSLSMLINNVASHYTPILYCDTLMGINFQPNYYIDVTDCFSKKKDAILQHASQDPQRFVDLAILMNSYRAAQCNAPQGTYAEAYCHSSGFPFSDIRGLLPPPPKLRPFHIKNQYGFL